MLKMGRWVYLVFTVSSILNILMHAIIGQDWCDVILKWNEEMVQGIKPRRDMRKWCQPCGKELVAKIGSVLDWRSRLARVR